MRTKPTIIAFKTPSMENCEYELTPNGGKIADSFFDLKSTFFSRTFHNCSSYFFSGKAPESPSENMDQNPRPDALAVAAEEGRLRPNTQSVERQESIRVLGKNQFNVQPAINYPVGKPLEVNPLILGRKKIASPF